MSKLVIDLNCEKSIATAALMLKDFTHFKTFQGGASDVIGIDPAKPGADQTVVVNKPPVQEAAPVPTAPVTETVPTPPPVETPNMTIQELNGILVGELARLGGREKIDAMLAAAPFNVASLSHLDPSRYAEVADAVKAL